jgi:hypothetical protein
VGDNYEQIARLWISNEKNGALNTISSDCNLESVEDEK